MKISLAMLRATEIDSRSQQLLSVNRRKKRYLQPVSPTEIQTTYFRRIVGAPVVPSRPNWSLLETFNVSPISSVPNAAVADQALRVLTCTGSCRSNTATKARTLGKMYLVLSEAQTIGKISATIRCPESDDSPWFENVCGRGFRTSVA